MDKAFVAHLEGVIKDLETKIAFYKSLLKSHLNDLPPEVAADELQKEMERVSKPIITKEAFTLRELEAGIPIEASDLYNRFISETGSRISRQNYASGMNEIVKTKRPFRLMTIMHLGKKHKVWCLPQWCLTTMVKAEYHNRYIDEISKKIAATIELL